MIQLNCQQVFDSDDRISGLLMSIYNGSITLSNDAMLLLFQQENNKGSKK